MEEHERMSEQRSGGVCVLSFYKFVEMDGLEDIRDFLVSLCEENDMTGTFILAFEGINATVAGSRTALDKVAAWLSRDPKFAGTRLKFSCCGKNPFHRFKVKIKDELVPLGVEWVNPSRICGERVSAGNWNELISRPEVLVIDTRNDYECRVGSFRGAINPQTVCFREFPGYVEKNLDPERHTEIAMFCTGGIRCEKATSYLLEKGFQQVYQLEGGVLSYLESISRDLSLWEGECFVFDGRTSLRHGLSEGKWSTCHNCREPVSPQDRFSEKFREGVWCPRCRPTLTPQRISSLEERQRQMKLAGERNSKHIGAVIKRGCSAGGRD